jgi:hypothetical protein
MRNDLFFYCLCLSYVLMRIELMFIEKDKWIENVFIYVLFSYVIKWMSKSEVIKFF